jgi:hypothetical protein
MPGLFIFFDILEICDLGPGDRKRFIGPENKRNLLIWNDIKKILHPVITRSNGGGNLKIKHIQWVERGRNVNRK